MIHKEWLWKMFWQFPQGLSEYDISLCQWAAGLYNKKVLKLQNVWGKAEQARVWFCLLTSTWSSRLQHVCHPGWSSGFQKMDERHLTVCFVVSKITQKVMNRFWWNFHFNVDNGRKEQMVEFWWGSSYLIVCLFIATCQQNKRGNCITDFYIDFIW